MAHKTKSKAAQQAAFCIGQRIAATGSPQSRLGLGWRQSAWQKISADSHPHIATACQSGMHFQASPWLHDL
jgi:hypothetical protein